MACNCRVSVTIWYCLIVVSAATQLAFADAENPTPRVAYGTLADPEQFPSIVSIGFGKDHFCAGTLIAKNLVLTAAHCMFISGRPNQLKPWRFFNVRSDGTNSSNFKQSLKVAREPWINPDYDDTALTIQKKRPIGDMAIMELGGVAKARPAYIATKEVPLGKEVTVAGWGYTEDNPPAVSKDLKFAASRLVNSSVCRDDFTFGKLPGVLCSETLVPDLPSGECPWEVERRQHGSGITRDLSLSAPVKGDNKFTSMCTFDSGGPHYLAGTNTVIACHSFGESRPCGKRRWNSMSSTAFRYQKFIKPILDEYGYVVPAKRLAGDSSELRQIRSGEFALQVQKECSNVDVAAKKATFYAVGQRWTFVPTEKTNVYRISSASRSCRDRWLTVPAGGCAKGTQAFLDGPSSQARPRQLWKVTKSADGGWVIRSTYCDKYLVVLQSNNATPLLKVTPKDDFKIIDVFAPKN